MIDFSKIESEYGTDPEKTNNGIWKDIALIPGMRIKVAQSGNPEYRKMLRALYKPYSRMINAGQELPQAKEEEIQNILLAKTIMKDWEGVPSTDENPVPYNYENAMAVLTNPKLKALREEIMQHADDFASYKLDIIEDAKKNSENS